MARKRKTEEEKIADGLEALARVQSRVVSANDVRVIEAFAERGIVATPRVDVFTYKAWFALGRQVRRGEKSVRVTVWLPVPDKDGTKGRMIARTAYVFHKSQTDAIEGREDRSDTAAAADIADLERLEIIAGS